MRDKLLLLQLTLVMVYMLLHLTKAAVPEASVIEHSTACTYNMYTQAYTCPTK